MPQEYQLQKEYFLRRLPCEAIDGTYNRYCTFQSDKDFIFAFASEWHFTQLTYEPVIHWDVENGVLTDWTFNPAPTYPAPLFSGVIEGVIFDCRVHIESYLGQRLATTTPLPFNDYKLLILPAGRYHFRIPAIYPGEYPASALGIGVWVYEKI